MLHGDGRAVVAIGGGSGRNSRGNGDPRVGTGGGPKIEGPGGIEGGGGDSSGVISSTRGMGALTINGNITVTSTAGRGVLFGASTGLVTLANGFTINAPAGSYTTGTLTLKGFTQVGPTAQTLTLTVPAAPGMTT